MFALFCFIFLSLGTRNKKNTLKLLVKSEFNDIYIYFEYTKKYSEEKIFQSRHVIKLVSKIKN